MQLQDLFAIKKHRYTLCITMLFSFGSYIYLGYFFSRENTTALLGCYSILFGCFYYWYQDKRLSLDFLVKLSFLLRLVFIISVPFLSQDFYRFIWDGRLLHLGYNPYIHLPKELIINPEFTMMQASELHQKMGTLSAKHYSNYPPINQFLFYIATFFSSSKSLLPSIITMRVVLITADYGIYYFGKKLLLQMKKNPRLILLYLLNPFIILECSANLHFESAMLFFVLWSFYLLEKNKITYSAFIMSLGIGVKLIPLILMPFFLQRIGLKKTIHYGLVILGSLALFFAGFLSKDFIANYQKTIGLWFTNFEFNASIYYLIRYIGYQITGYNVIGSIGKILPLLTIGFILIRVLVQKKQNSTDFYTAMLFGLSMHFFLSTTVHPWYIANLVVLSIFTRYRFAMVWSFTVILSYSAYANSGFKEQPIALWIAYLLVYGYLGYEMIQNKKIKTL